MFSRPGVYDWSRTWLHGHPVERVRRLHRLLLMGHDEQLSGAAEVLDQLQEAAKVGIVERRLDLVHDVEGARTRLEHGEQERQRRQRTFST